MKEGAKNILKTVGLGYMVEKIEAGFCPTCGKPVSKEDLRDDLSKEFDNSGMCAKCQNS
jgi:hypothetical protein